MSKRKGLSKGTKELYASLGRNLFLCFVAFFTIVVTTAAWFVNNTNVSGGGANVTATDGIRFLLATKQEDAQGIYDVNQSVEHTENSSASPLAKVLKEFYRTDNGTRFSSFQNLPSLTAGTEIINIGGYNYVIGNDDGISLRVNDTSNLNNYGDKEFIEPGTAGSFTFYIIPKVDNLDDVNISVCLKLYRIVNEGISSVGKAEYIEYSEQKMMLFNMFKGHLLLFKDISDGSYVNRICPDTDNDEIIYKFTASGQTMEKGKAYPVTVYWNWPKRLENILYSGNEDSLFPSECEEKSKLITWINLHKNCFVNSKSVDIGNLGDLSSNMSNKQFSLWNNGYNRGDQLIGNNVAYFEWVIEAN